MIEEISRVDPAVGTLVDVQNTLVNTLVRKYGTKHQRDLFLPRLAKGVLSSSLFSGPHRHARTPLHSLILSFFFLTCMCVCVHRQSLFARADTVGSFALSEASSGSDAFALKATAVPSGKKVRRAWRFAQRTNA